MLLRSNPFRVLHRAAWTKGWGGGRWRYGEKMFGSNPIFCQFDLEALRAPQNQGLPFLAISNILHITFMHIAGTDIFSVRSLLSLGLKEHVCFLQWWRGGEKLFIKVMWLKEKETPCQVSFSLPIATLEVIQTQSSLRLSERTMFSNESCYRWLCWLLFNISRLALHNGHISHDSFHVNPKLDYCRYVVCVKMAHDMTLLLLALYLKGLRFIKTFLTQLPSNSVLPLTLAQETPFLSDGFVIDFHCFEPCDCVKFYSILYYYPLWVLSLLRRKADEWIFLMNK